MSNSQKRRLWVAVSGLAFLGLLLVLRLFNFQVLNRVNALPPEVIVESPARGIIFDRLGAVLAANGADYRVSAAPNWVTEPQALASALAPILDQPVYPLLAKLQANRPYVVIEWRVTPDVAEAIRALPYEGLTLEPLPRRFYPQGSMLSHVLGYVDFDGIGRAGIESRYDREMAGEAASRRVNASPLVVPEDSSARDGADLILTIDRSVQFTVEKHLQEALAEYGAESGIIIVMDPRTGAILSMAAEPDFDPFSYHEVDRSILLNPITSRQFEPGSVIKLVTMAAALDSGTVTPNSTYFDAGELWVGGHRTVNWTRSAHGTVDMTTLLAQSLNVGAATLATWMGPDTFYDYFDRFGFGSVTGIDLTAEVEGLMPRPGGALWTESFLATNAYGQSIAVTPLQMISAVAALANDGKRMQPYLVQEIRMPDRTIITEPTVVAEAVRPEIAHQVTAMAAAALSIAVPQSQVPGYTIAGKTGTAQIPENGIYLPDEIIGTFVGYLPADNPEVIVYIKLDRPDIPWGSQTAAPAFAKLAKELVILLDIPPDSVRLQGDISAVRSTEQ